MRHHCPVFKKRRVLQKIAIAFARIQVWQTSQTETVLWLGNVQTRTIKVIQNIRPNKGRHQLWIKLVLQIQKALKKYLSRSSQLCIRILKQLRPYLVPFKIMGMLDSPGIMPPGKRIRTRNITVGLIKHPSCSAQSRWRSMASTRRLIRSLRIILFLMVQLFIKTKLLHLN